MKDNENTELKIRFRRATYDFSYLPTIVCIFVRNIIPANLFREISLRCTNSLINLFRDHRSTFRVIVNGAVCKEVIREKIP